MAFDLMERARQLAEEGRNYTAGFAGTGQSGTPGTTGSEGGTSSTYDPNAALPAVPWSGPSAYGMSPAGSEFPAGDEAAMYAALARAQQFDPNASLSQQVRTTGGEGGGIDQTYYTLNYDQSRVPAPVHPGLSTVGNYGSTESVYDENRLFNDPNYGVMTDPRNLKGDQGFDWIGTLGPALVGGFAFGIPAAAAGLSAGAIGGAAGGTALPWYGQAGLSTAKQVGSGQFDPYGTVAAFAPGIANLGPTPVDNWDLMGNSAAYGLPPSTELNYGDISRSVGAGARAAGSFNQLQQQRQRQPTQTQLSYNPQNFGKLNQPLVGSGDTQQVANNYADSPYGFSYGGGGP